MSIQERWFLKDSFIAILFLSDFKNIDVSMFPKEIKLKKVIKGN